MIILLVGPATTGVFPAVAPVCGVDLFAMRLVVGPPLGPVGQSVLPCGFVQRGSVFAPISPAFGFYLLFVGLVVCPAICQPLLPLHVPLLLLCNRCLFALGCEYLVPPFPVTGSVPGA